METSVEQSSIVESRYNGIVWLERLRQVGIFIALMIIVVSFSFLSPIFLTPSNIINILVQSTLTGIIGVGMTLVIISGGIDLSVGSLVALVVCVVATQMVEGVSVPMAIVIGLLLGVLAGAINGFLVAYVGLQPFLVTLGTMSLFRGAALIYTNGNPIFEVPKSFRNIFSGTVLNIPNPILYMLGVAVFAYIILNYTRLGIYIKAIGGNEEAARMAGVNTRRSKITTYILASTLTALAALVMLGRLGAAEPIAGSGFELDAIAASAVGGTSMSGGKGNIPGTILGALILGSLRNGLTLMNVQSFYQLVASGAIILLAVSVDRFTRGRA